jgi:hypothetical protein
MKLKEWLERKDKSQNATFLIARAVKDEHTPYYHDEFRTTPIRSVWEWLDSEMTDKYIIVCKDHAPIDTTGGGWMNWYKSGRLDCAIITTEKDVFTRYSESQGKEMLEMYDERARK